MYCKEGSVWNSGSLFSDAKPPPKERWGALVRQAQKRRRARLTPRTRGLRVLKIDTKVRRAGDRLRSRSRHQETKKPSSSTVNSNLGLDVSL
ncbi:hypothetical protein PI126_g9415 [Phytophthora idaei]|nr:hypothetical protein PI126_g9415 [Phytophthora idaei]